MVTSSPTDTLSALLADEARRQELFPVSARKIFLSHAAVTVLPQPVADAMADYVRASAEDFIEFPTYLRVLQEARSTAAGLIHASPEEIALLGPTSLGLSLFANGIRWAPGDEVICYQDDYPANVYPWLNLRTRGVTVRLVQPSALGAITTETIEPMLNQHTRLVALASCHFVSGYRLDITAIGKMLRERNILFSVDAIQTLGAFPTTVEYVDFLSADAHKWLLGPLASGIVYVRKECFDLCRPTLLGSWNIKAPNFVSRDELEFLETAQRYEPGALNMPGIVGTKTAIDLLQAIGIDQIAARLLALHTYITERLARIGFQLLGPREPQAASGIATFSHPTANLVDLHRQLTNERVVCSLRQDRAGNNYLRFSPHFYNTEAELDQVVAILERQVAGGPRH